MHPREHCPPDVEPAVYVRTTDGGFVPLVLADAQSGEKKVWVALDDEDARITGFASVGPSRDEDADRTTLEIYTIYLEPSVWGHGVARDLMRTILAEPAAEDPPDVRQDNRQTRAALDRVDRADVVDRHGQGAGDESAVTFEVSDDWRLLRRVMWRAPSRRFRVRMEPLPRWRRVLEDEVLSNGVYAAVNEVGRLRPRWVPGLNRLSTRVLSRREYDDLAPRVFASSRRVRFVESEYAVPAEAAASVVQELRDWVDRHEDVAVQFPVEVRFAAADDVWLSTAYGRDTAYVAVHQFHRSPARRYFRAFADIARAHALGFHLFVFWYAEKIVLKLHNAREVGSDDPSPMIRAFVADCDKLAMRAAPLRALAWCSAIASSASACGVSKLAGSCWSRRASFCARAMAVAAAIASAAEVGSGAPSGAVSSGRWPHSLRRPIGVFSRWKGHEMNAL